MKVMFRSPKILNFAKSTPQVGGRYLRRRRDQHISRGQTIEDAIRAAALKWSYAPFDRLYSLRDRIQHGWIAVLQNAERISFAHNPPAMAYTIVVRVLNRLYRDAFLDGRPRQQQFGANNEELRIIEFAATDSPFERSPSPNAVPQMYSNARQIEFDERFHRLLRKLPAAMAGLDKVERDVIRLYFGFDDQPLTVRQVAHIIERAPSTTQVYLHGAVQKLRVSLGIDGRGRRRRKR